MTYQRFLKSKDLVQQLLTLLDMIYRETVLIELDHTPNYNLSPYVKDDISDYVFINKWYLPDNYETVFNFHIIGTRIFHFDHLQELSRASGIPYHENHTYFLNRVLGSQPQLLSEHGFEPGLDEFKLRHIRVKSINNDLRSVEYEGSFLGDAHCIDPVDWKLYATVELEGLSFLSGLDFYKSLIAESFSLWKEGKNKLACFLLHAAFESFVNSELATKDESQRFTEKVKELYTHRFGNLATHQAYTTLINDLNELSNVRNAIAHGRERVEIKGAVMEAAFICILTLITSYQYNCQSFSDISQLLLRRPFETE